jgi:hypothetical protein
MVAGKLTVFDPTADERVGQDSLADRLTTFDGRVVGLLNNTKDRAEIILDQVEQQLRSQFPGVEIRHYRKESVSGMGPIIEKRLADEVDALVSAVGD